MRGGEAGYTALIGQDYTREDGTAASGYYVGKKFDVSQTRGRQPDRAPVYACLLYTSGYRKEPAVNDRCEMFLYECSQAL